MTPGDDKNQTLTFDDLALDEQAVVSPTATTILRGLRDDAGAPPPHGAEEVVRGRYTLGDLLGEGGMAQVYRAWDARLQRNVALKLMRPSLAAVAGARTRFLEEAQAMARLQHPGIVPVYDIDENDTGLPFFTMKEIRGRTFAEILVELHAASRPGRWGETLDGWSFARLLDAFRRACEAVAHAHARGYVHRDLKPANLMAGAHGEALVLDWGIAHLADPSAAADPETSGIFLRSPAAGSRTQGVAGTPAYMAPEQADGNAGDARTDVYALGASLHEILHGAPPYVGDDPWQVLAAVEAGRRTLVVPDTRVPDELHALVEACLQRDPAARPQQAGQIAEALRDWQEGATKRARALASVAAAESVRAQVADAAGEAARLTAQERRLEDGIRAHAPIATKLPWWEAQDSARAAQDRVEDLEAAVEAHLAEALAHAPDLPEAHAALAALHQAHHAAAEAAHDRDARRHLERLARHDRDLTWAAYRRGDGALSLATDVAAEVRLYRFQEIGRRLVPVYVRSLGATPLAEVALPMGSWLLEICAVGHEVVRYPVHIGRGEHHDGIAPGATRPTPVVLPLVGTLAPDEIYVPAGWAWTGGDPDAGTSAPRTRRWVESFVIQSDPVTNAGYIAFLDALVAAGQESEALRHAPRPRSAGAQSVYGRDPEGRFVLVPDAEGDVWAADWPVFLIDAAGARAYAAWRAEADGHAWRLPDEASWEKAARGVDGRFFPWGDDFDAFRACVRESWPGRPMPSPVGVVGDPETVRFAADVSLYGVRGCAGGVSDLCVGDDGATVLRGGAWSMLWRHARLAQRRVVQEDYRSETFGVRLVRRA